MCFIVRVWQKVALLAVVSTFTGGRAKFFLVLVGCLGSLVGGLGGMRQTEVRRLLGYSSINHSGWIVAGIIFSVFSFVIYFVVYALVRIFLFYQLSSIEVNRYSSLLSGFGLRGGRELVTLRLLILTLAGLPPTIGFSIKWSILFAVRVYSFIIALFLVLGSLITLYFYSCLSFIWFIFSSTKGREGVKVSGIRKFRGVAELMARLGLGLLRFLFVRCFL